MRIRAVDAVVFGTVVGLAAGVGAYTFIYARGGSYLTNDPAACANCHVMRDYYDAWAKSSHRAVAVCNDCHTPHALVPKYMTKASNGWHHSFAFTSGRFPDALQIKPHNLEITESACRSCHEQVTGAIEPISAHASTLSCVRCHDSVGHAE
jgi:cytochrome c nitrite reductase small subunit